VESLRQAISYVNVSGGRLIDLVDAPQDTKHRRQKDLSQGWAAVLDIMRVEHPEFSRYLSTSKLSDKWRRVKHLMRDKTDDSYVSNMNDGEADDTDQAEEDERGEVVVDVEVEDRDEDDGDIIEEYEIQMDDTSLENREEGQLFHTYTHEEENKPDNVEEEAVQDRNTSLPMRNRTKRKKPSEENDLVRPLKMSTASRGATRMLPRITPLIHRNVKQPSDVKLSVRSDIKRVVDKQAEPIDQDWSNDDLDDDHINSLNEPQQSNKDLYGGSSSSIQDRQINFNMEEKKRINDQSLQLERLKHDKEEMRKQELHKLIVEHHHLQNELLRAKIEAVKRQPHLPNSTNSGNLNNTDGSSSDKCGTK